MYLLFSILVFPIFYIYSLDIDIIQNNLLIPVCFYSFNAIILSFIYRKLSNTSDPIKKKTSQSIYLPIMLGINIVLTKHILFLL